MPPLPKPNPQKRKSGWLLRDSYKEDMKVERKNVRERMKDPKFNPLKSAKYNLKRAIYRSINLPEISKALEDYVKEGHLSKPFAKAIVQSFVEINRKNLTRTSSKEELITISKKPKLGIENGYNNIIINSEHKVDPITKNKVIIRRTPNGRVTIIVLPEKN